MYIRRCLSNTPMVHRSAQLLAMAAEQRPPTSNGDADFQASVARGPECAALRNEWNALDVAAPSPMESRTWIESAWDTVASAKLPVVLAVRQANALVEGLLEGGDGDGQREFLPRE